MNLLKDQLDLKLIEHDSNVNLAKFAVSQIPGLLQTLSMYVAAVLTIEELLLRLSNQKIRSFKTQISSLLLKPLSKVLFQDVHYSAQASLIC